MHCRHCCTSFQAMHSNCLCGEGGQAQVHSLQGNLQSLFYCVHVLVAWSLAFSTSLLLPSCLASVFMNHPLRLLVPTFCPGACRTTAAQCAGGSCQQMTTPMRPGKSGKRKKQRTGRGQQMRCRTMSLHTSSLLGVAVACWQAWPLRPNGVVVLCVCQH